MTTLEITKTIDIQAPIDTVWAALTDPDLISQWFGEHCEFDPRPGGRAVFGWAEHGVDFRAIVEHLDRPKTLIYRWARESGVEPAPGNSTVVRFDLTETDAGTRLSLIETGFDDLADPTTAHGENTEGWHAELGDLTALVENR